jgi:3-oxoacyl-[acyl-carrier-protein] synthase-3
MTTKSATGAYIAAVEYAVPAHVITNEELAKRHPEWQMEKVAVRTGVESRRWCDDSETALDLAEEACHRLFARSEDFAPQQIDVVLFCTQTPDHIMPPNACLLQHRLGLRQNVAALDYSLACSGFVYGLFLANGLVRSGAARNVLIVTAETYSKLSHPDDRGTRTLFGDAGAVTWIGSGQCGIGQFLLGTDGGGATSFCVPGGGARRQPLASMTNPSTPGVDAPAHHIVMNGAAVFDFVKREIPGLVRDLLCKARLSLDDLDLVLFHQASQLSLDYLHRTLRIPPEKQFIDLLRVGNTVSASLPIVLRDAELAGVLRQGMRVMLVGFGVGLSWGACIVEWS